MDKMSITNILTVGVPEVLLGFVIILLIFNITDQYKENKISFVFKLIISTIGTLSLIHFNRKFVSNITHIALMSTIFYSTTLAFVWRFNFRKAIFGGSLIMFILILSENTTTFPICQLLLKNIAPNEFLNVRFIWSIPTRVIQLLIILFVIRFKFSLQKHVLLNLQWKDLSVSKKTTSACLVLLMILSIYFNANYGEIFMKLKTNNIDVHIFNTNLIIIFIQTVIYIGLTMVLLNRTSDYENYKHILHSDKNQIIETIIEQSECEELKKIIDIATRTIERRC